MQLIFNVSLSKIYFKAHYDALYKFKVYNCEWWIYFFKQVLQLSYQQCCENKMYEYKTKYKPRLDIFTVSDFTIHIFLYDISV